MLSEKMRQHDVKCFLVNTGWVGGGFGVGERMNLKYTRAMVNSAIAGELDQVTAIPHPIFHVAVPTSCPGVPPGILDARSQWKDRGAYDRQAQNLDGLFRKNFEKFGEAAQEILGAVPAAR
jgi:phosphoenolpyruvate carboxykinase (ATP)